MNRNQPALAIRRVNRVSGARCMLSLTVVRWAFSVWAVYQVQHEDNHREEREAVPEWWVTIAHRFKQPDRGCVPISGHLASGS